MAAGYVGLSVVALDVSDYEVEMGRLSVRHPEQRRSETDVGQREKILYASSVRVGILVSQPKRAGCVRDHRPPWVRSEVPGRSCLGLRLRQLGQYRPHGTPPAWHGYDVDTEERWRTVLCCLRTGGSGQWHRWLRPQVRCGSGVRLRLRQQWQARPPRVVSPGDRDHVVPEEHCGDRRALRHYHHRRIGPRIAVLLRGPTAKEGATTSGGSRW